MSHLLKRFGVMSCCWLLGAFVTGCGADELEVIGFEQTSQTEFAANNTFLWASLEWGDCIVENPPCDETGTQTRKVHCVEKDKNDNIVGEVDISNCSGPMPNSEQSCTINTDGDPCTASNGESSACEDGECPIPATPQWWTGDWGQCFKDNFDPECFQNGTEYRDVECQLVPDNGTNDGSHPEISKSQCRAEHGNWSEPDDSQWCFYETDGDSCIDENNNWSTCWSGQCEVVADYQWDIGDWSTCSGFVDECDETGTQSRSVQCVDQSTGQVVADWRCPNPDPVETQTCSRDTDGDVCTTDSNQPGTCTIGTCIPSQQTYSWNIGSWGICTGFSNVCDETGMQSRSVQCVSDQTGQVVADSNCSQPKPVTSQSCVRDTDGDPCGDIIDIIGGGEIGVCVNGVCQIEDQEEYIWRPGDWGPCQGFDGECGQKGFQERPIFCYDVATRQQVSSSLCDPTTAPATMQDCERNSDGLQCTGGECLNGECVGEDTYSWQTSSWSSCAGFANSCDETGEQSRDVWCQNDQTGDIVSSSFCSGAPPASSTGCVRDTDGDSCGVNGTCVNSQCVEVTYEWQAGSWGACQYSNTCDESGLQFRNIICVRTDTNAPVPASFCSGQSQPSSTQACSRDTDGDVCIGGVCENGSCEIPENYIWDVGTWGVCGDFAGECGETGQQVRTVRCIEEGSGVQVSNSLCNGSQPTAVQLCFRDTDGNSCDAGSGTCTNGQCVENATYFWFSSAWSSCNGFDSACDETGRQSRLVECRESGTNNVVADNLCSGQKPLEETTCLRDTDGLPCPGGTCAQGMCEETIVYEWEIGSWSQCQGFDDTCDEEGTQFRRVQCIRTDSGAAVHESFCSGAIPQSTQACDRDTDGNVCRVAQATGSCVSGVCITSSYAWRTGNWSVCTDFDSACDETGTQLRNVWCVETSTGQQVANSNCSGTQPESASDCVRNTNGFSCSGGQCLNGQCVEPRDYQWDVSGWSECGGFSGGTCDETGTRSRTVRCIDIATGQSVSTSLCQGTLPVSNEVCLRDTDGQDCGAGGICSNETCLTDIDYVWITDLLGPCEYAGECAEYGDREHRTKCVDRVTRVQVPDSFCIGNRPDDRVICKRHEIVGAPCPSGGGICLNDVCVPDDENATYVWRAQAWSSCRDFVGECGETGSQTRVVDCVNEETGASVSPSFCTDTMPAETQSCARDTDGNGCTGGICQNEICVSSDCDVNDPDADCDGDGLSNGNEDCLGTSSLNPDSDGDGLCDGNQTVSGICVAGENLNDDCEIGDDESDPTDPCDPDGSRPGCEGPVCDLSDADADCDDDGLTNGQEDNSCTDPESADTDGDGILDGVEDANRSSEQEDGETDPCDPDSDGDGFCDGSEAISGVCISGEDFNNDGVRDDGEFDPLDPCDPVSVGPECGSACDVNDMNADCDNDGCSNGDEAEAGTSPVDPDTDNDGIRDCLEINCATDPLDPDSDGDGFCDGSLTVSGTCVRGEDLNNNCVLESGESDPTDACNPISTDASCDNTCDLNDLEADCDNDGLPNQEEFMHGSDPENPDTDGDGILDGVEDANQDGTTGPQETSPIKADSDHDGFCDGSETVLADDTFEGCIRGEDLNNDGNVDPGESDPLDPCDPVSTDPGCPSQCDVNDPAADCDSDGVTNGNEDAIGSDPENPDSDADGIPDGVENADQDGVVDDGETDPTNPDSDRDGFCDGSQSVMTVCDSGEDLNNNGIFDEGESDPLDPCDPISTDEELCGTGCDLDDPNADCDNDGLTNGTEAELGTNPLLPDTDRDGYLDGEEDANGDGVIGDGESDPLDPCDPDATTAACLEDGCDITDIAGDCDSDGITNGIENSTGTNPRSADSDGDGYCDGAEAVLDTSGNELCIGGEDTNMNGVVDEGESDPRDPCDPDDTTQACIDSRVACFDDSDCGADQICLTDGDAEGFCVDPKTYFVIGSGCINCSASDGISLVMLLPLWGLRRRRRRR